MSSSAAHTILDLWAYNFFIVALESYLSLRFGGGSAAMVGRACAWMEHFKRFINVLLVLPQSGILICTLNA